MARTRNSDQIGGRALPSPSPTTSFDGSLTPTSKRDKVPMDVKAEKKPYRKQPIDQIKDGFSDPDLFNISGGIQSPLPSPSSLKRCRHIKRRESSDITTDKSAKIKKEEPDVESLSGLEHYTNTSAKVKKEESNVQSLSGLELYTNTSAKVKKEEPDLEALSGLEHAANPSAKVKKEEREMQAFSGLELYPGQKQAKTVAEILKPALKVANHAMLSKAKSTQSKSKGGVTWADRHPNTHSNFDEEENWTNKIQPVTGEPSIADEKIDFSKSPLVSSKEPQSASFYDISTLGKRPPAKRKNPFDEASTTPRKKTVKTEPGLITPPSTVRGTSERKNLVTIDLTGNSDPVTSDDKSWPEAAIPLSPFKSAFATSDATEKLLGEILQKPRALNLYEASAAFKFLQKSLRSFTKTHFTYKLCKTGKANWPLHSLAKDHPEFFRYTQYIADGSQYGWRKLFTESYARPHLAYALMGWALKTYVFDATAFGLSREPVDELEDQDRLYLYYEGFTRTRLRGKMLADILSRTDAINRKRDMQAAADNLSEQLTELLTPLYQSTNCSGLPSKEIRNTINHLVTLTATIALSIRLSGANGTIFRYTFPDKRTPYQMGHGISEPQNCVNKKRVEATNGQTRLEDQEGFQPLVKMSCFPSVIATVPHGLDMGEMEDAIKTEPDFVKKSIRYDERTGEHLGPKSWVSEVRICPADVYLEWTPKAETLDPKWKLKLSEAVAQARSEKYPSKVRGFSKMAKIAKVRFLGIPKGTKTLKGVAAVGAVVAAVGLLAASVPGSSDVLYNSSDQVKETARYCVDEGRGVCGSFKERMRSVPQVPLPEFEVEPSERDLDAATMETVDEVASEVKEEADPEPEAAPKPQSRKFVKGPADWFLNALPKSASYTYQQDRTPKLGVQYKGGKASVRKVSIETDADADASVKDQQHRDSSPKLGIRYKDGKVGVRRADPDAPAGLKEQIREGYESVSGKASSVGNKTAEVAGMVWRRYFARP